MISVKNIFITAFMLLQSVIFVQGVVAQNRNSIWCFGDSAGIDFSILNNPVPINTGMDSRGSCASISDSLGNLLFYASDPYPPTFLNGVVYTGAVYGKNHSLMANGDTIVGRGWYNEIVIIPLPENDSIYYLFNCGVTSIFGLYYSIVNINANNGLGEVIQKNIQLQSFATTDCINAIKHGNGRDWWVIFRESGAESAPPDNNYYEYLITPSGISNVIVQSVGSLNSTNLGKISFNASGDQMVFTSRAGAIELYDFDRCSGIITNPNTIHAESLNPPYYFFAGNEFSPNGEILYVSIPDITSSFIFQLDLNSANIWDDRDTTWVSNFPTESIGMLKRGPNGKIYESGPDTSPIGFIYPYPDTLYTMYNMYLGVINSPDSLGAACDFQPYSFYLGGKRTYWGLPNNPDYELGPLVGSPCDTLVSLNELAGEAAAVGSLHVYYHTAWDKAFINAEHLKGKVGKLLLYNLQGQLIHEEPLKIQNGYYTKDLSMIGQSSGMYLVVVETEKERLTKKFVK